MMPSVVVPAFPYEGGFHWFLDPRPSFLSHPYYSLLYGPTRETVASRSVALASLFDEIVLAPADVWLPDRGSSESGGRYVHPDLRLEMDWRTHPEWAGERQPLVYSLLKAPLLANLLNEEPSLTGNLDAQFQFVSRVLVQMQLADEKMAVLLGNSFFHRVRNALLMLMGRYTDAMGQHHLGPVDETMLDVVGLDLAPHGVDSFAAVRQSKEIRDYASKFRQAVGQASATQNPNEALLELMAESAEKASVRRHVSGAFQTVGSAANVGGLIPFVGSIASAVGIAADAGSRLTMKQSSEAEWYLLGPKMRSVALEGLLRNRRVK